MTDDLDPATEAIVVLDDRGWVVDANPAASEIFGRTRNDLIHADPVTLCPAAQPDGRPSTAAVRRHVATALETGYARFDWVYLTARGPVACRVELTALPPERGRLVRATITELVAAAEREVLETLAGGLAHELGNQLAAVIANAGMLAATLPADGAEHAMARDALRSAERAADVVRQLLAYAGKARVERGAVAIGALAREVGDHVAASLGAARLRYELTETPPIFGDAAQLREAIAHLVLNAADALAGAPGEITVRVRIGDVDRDALVHDHLPPDAGACVHLEVSDGGGGMTADVKRRMFDPFFTTKFAGRGLGLAALRGIVRTHGGGIHVVSAPGAGTTVGLVFAPLECAEAAGGVVLVVDDERPVRTAIRRMLGSAGYTVTEAADGPAGIALVEAHPELCAVVLDVTMPGMSGLEVLDRIRALRPRLPVLLSTGLADVDAARADGLLPKPYAPKTLIAALAAAIRARAMAR